MIVSIIPYHDSAPKLEPIPNSLHTECSGTFYKLTDTIETYVPEWDMKSLEITGYNKNHVKSNKYHLFGYYEIEKCIGTFYQFQNGTKKVYIPKLILSNLSSKSEHKNNDDSSDYDT
jgi:hypothetical protein